jgi:coiled-coil domain-containing protein 130
MSSLAATQADGYYLPVAYYESGAYKKQSKNQWHDSNANADERKRKSNNQNKSSSRDTNTVRFELPVSGICQGCRTMVSKGTRFNATKIRTDEMYFSTQIWEFQSTCRACKSQPFVIRTDPAARGFRYVSGITKVQQEGQDGMEECSKATRDPIQTGIERLERKQAAISQRQELQALLQTNEVTHKNDADGNAAIRATFRVDRSAKKQLLKEGAALGWRPGMALVGGTIQDQVQAKSATYGNGKRHEQERMNKLRQSGIFHDSMKDTKHRKRRRQQRESESTDLSIAQPDTVQSRNEASPSVVGSTTRSSRRSKRLVEHETPTLDLTNSEETTFPKRRLRKLLVTGDGSITLQMLEPSPKEASPPLALEALAAYESD